MKVEQINRLNNQENLNTIPLTTRDYESPSLRSSKVMMDAYQDPNIAASLDKLNHKVPRRDIRVTKSIEFSNLKRLTSNAAV